MIREPLSPPAAKALIQKILVSGQVSFSKHAFNEMANDKEGEISTVDVTNVLRGGWVEQGEFENNSWRYRVRTQKMGVVVAFRSESELRIVTAWREKS